jgi:hypothetical protein
MHECREDCQGYGKRADYGENDEGGTVTHADSLLGAGARRAISSPMGPRATR